jgi:cell division protein ZipA
MQPRELDNPAAVFEDFVDTIQALAERLDGVAWDNQRQPLTLDTIEQFRDILAD